MPAADQWTVLLQIGVAAILGAAVGIERELGGRPAGLRTHMLVSAGAALFTLAGMDLAGSDPTRIAAQVVTGIGFLGGGAILRAGVSVRGLTTAASLWVTAAIGLAVGLGQWYAAVATTVLALAVLSLVKYFEREVLPRGRLLEIVLSLEPDAHLDQVEHEVHDLLPKVRLLRVAYDPNGQSLVLAAPPQEGTRLGALAERLRGLSGVQGVEVSQ